MRLGGLALGIALLAPGPALAHPHIWILQQVRPIVVDGKYTQVEVDWRFDPETSESEIAAIDENHDGKFSAAEIRLLVKDTMPGFEKDGFMTFLNTGGKDFRPAKAASFAARIEAPASFAPPDWDRHAGDKDEPAEKGPAASAQLPRNLVYTMRYALPQPTKTFSLTTFDPEYFVRYDIDRAKLAAGCRWGKHPTYKSEFIPGQPVFADTIACKLP